MNTKNSPATKKPTREASLKSRLRLLTLFFFVLFFVLIVRLFYVMVIDGPRLEAMALRQQTRTSSLHAQRGRFLDSNGTVLAQSGRTYQVLVNPQVLMGKEDEASERVRISILVADLLGLDYQSVFEKVSRTARQQLVLKRQVSEDVVNQITALQLGGTITFSVDYTRYYSNGTLFAQLIGFTGADSEGQTGLEAFLDEYLAGKEGKTVYPKDARGNELAYGDAESQYIAPENGADVYLTCDANVETYLESALAACMRYNTATRVYGMVMNPKTGEILAEAANPTFDLNSPDRSDVTGLMAMSRNRVVTDTYECGSLFRMITLAAALDSGKVDLSTTFNCTGSMTFRTEAVYCEAKHGKQTLAEACQNNCGCAFAQMALSMGTDTFYKYIYAFGFDTKTKSGLPNEDTGSVTHRKYIREPDLARLGMGYGITATTMQMAKAYCALINGGIVMQPYVVEKIQSPDDGSILLQNEPTQLTRVIRADTSKTVIQLMQSIVLSGDGNNGQLLGYDVGGKTGLSRKYKANGDMEETLMVCSFAGFAPANDPELLCIIVADEPRVPIIRGTSIIAPFVRDTLADLMQYYGFLPASNPDTKKVPNLIGSTVDDAEYSLKRTGLTAAKFTDTERTATVTLQLPEAGAEVPVGSKVVLYSTMTGFTDEGTMSTYVAVPNLINYRRQDAYDLCNKVELTLAYDKNACLQKIDSQSIEAGTLVPRGTEIYVTFTGALPSKTPVDAIDNENTPTGE